MLLFFIAHHLFIANNTKAALRAAVLFLPYNKVMGGNFYLKLYLDLVKFYRD